MRLSRARLATVALVTLTALLMVEVVSTSSVQAQAPSCTVEYRYESAGFDVELLGGAAGQEVGFEADGDELLRLVVNPDGIAVTTIWGFGERGGTYDFSVAIYEHGPGGELLQRVECGSATKPVEGPEHRCSTEIGPDGLPRVLADGFGVELHRNGRFLGFGHLGPYVEVTAEPNTTYHYEAVIRDLEWGPSLVDCGSITTGEIALRDRLVLAATSAFMLAPYQYMTVRPTCPGCDEPFREVYAVPTEGNEAHPFQFVPPLGQQIDLPPNHPGFAPIPRLLYDLVEAIDDGDDVAVDLHRTGFPLSWSVNGYGGELKCWQVDTAPPDLRVGRCEMYQALQTSRFDATTWSQLIDGGLTDDDVLVLRMYRAVFDRDPDLRGSLYWMMKVEEGLDLSELSRLFLDSPEARLRWPDEPTRDELVDAVYLAALEREPDEVGLQYWSGQLDEGLGRSALLRWVVASEEMALRHPFDADHLRAWSD